VKTLALFLTQTMRKTSNPVFRDALARSLAAVVGRLSSGEATEMAALLAEGLDKETDALALGGLAEGLAAVADRLSPQEAAQRCTRAELTLAQALIRKTPDGGHFWSLPHGLTALATRLESREAKQVVLVLLQHLSQTTRPAEAVDLSKALAALAARLEPEDAKPFADLLTQSMSQKRTEVNLPALGITALAGKLAPREAARLVIQALDLSVDPVTLQSLAETLAAVADRLGPSEAASFCTQAASILLRSLSKHNHTVHFQMMAEGMNAVVASLPPREAADLLIRTMSQNGDSGAMKVLAQGLVAATAKLPPGEAAEFCAQAARIFTHGVNQPQDPTFLRTWAEGLAIVAGPLEPRKAALLLTQAISQTEADALVPLAQGLEAVLLREPTSRRRQRVCGAAGLVAGQVGLLTPGSFNPTVVGPALEAVPEPVPPRLLVELLRHPLCVGAPRREVLDVLGVHYQRTFADQWDFVRFAQEQKPDLLAIPQNPAGPSYPR
jgi:hypothetical protein